MHANNFIASLNKMPFLRLLPPLLAGILLQWYLPIGYYWIISGAVLSILLLLIYKFMPVGGKFRFQSLVGVPINLLLLFTGMLLIYFSNEKLQKNWYGNFVADDKYLVVSLAEPIVAKSNSYKADAFVLSICDSSGKEINKASGKIIMYFAKTGKAALLNYGDEIVIPAKLQQIKNAGNPGGFNYERYAQFQGLFHTAYLRDSGYVVTQQKNINLFRQAIFSAQQYIINSIQRYVSGDENVTSVAEALLIGYKQDLDKDLVQAYSNAGVVHIIAISGLHLGLIYLLLAWLAERLPFIKRSRFAKAIIILGCLWAFSLLTGASASVLRSAVMFTFIVLGKYFFRQASIYNSLAASAFVLLCYNPYLLWDVGFQLSYLAVLGIVWLQKPIEGLLVIPAINKPKAKEILVKPINTLAYTGNWLLREVWKMASITLAAQIATTPITLYYFHQFPNLFLFANLIAVPLSTLILYVEILLIIVSPINVIASVVGKVCFWLIYALNKIILWIDSISISKFDGIYANVATTIVLYAGFILTAYALVYNRKKIFIAGLGVLLLFSCIMFYYTYSISGQRKLVVYNTAKMQAVDFEAKNKYMFYGDSLLTKDAAPRNFYLRPARIALQASEQSASLEEILHSGPYWQWFSKKFMFIDTALYFPQEPVRMHIDVVLISKNARVKLKYLVQAIDPGVVVFDASNSRWKIEQWKSECAALNLRHYSVTDSGAFVYNIPSPPSQ